MFQSETPLSLTGRPVSVQISLTVELRCRAPYICAPATSIPKSSTLHSLRALDLQRELSLIKLMIRAEIVRLAVLGNGGCRPHPLFFNLKVNVSWSLSLKERG